MMLVLKTRDGQSYVLDLSLGDDGCFGSGSSLDVRTNEARPPKHEHDRLEK